MRTNAIRIVSIVLCTRPNRSIRWCVGRFASCCAVLIWDHKRKTIRWPFGTMFSFDRNKVSKLWILMRGSKLWLHSRSFRVANWDRRDYLHRAYRALLRGSESMVDHSIRMPSVCFIDKTVADYLYSIFLSDYLRVFGVWSANSRTHSALAPNVEGLLKTLTVDWQMEEASNKRIGEPPANSSPTGRSIWIDVDGENMFSGIHGSCGRHHTPPDTFHKNDLWINWEAHARKWTSQSQTIVWFHTISPRPSHKSHDWTMCAPNIRLWFGAQYGLKRNMNVPCRRRFMAPVHENFSLVLKIMDIM